MGGLSANGCVRRGRNVGSTTGRCGLRKPHDGEDSAMKRLWFVVASAAMMALAGAATGAAAYGQDGPAAVPTVVI